MKENNYTVSLNFLGSEVDCAARSPRRRRREKNLEPQKIDGLSTVCVNRIAVRIAQAGAAHSALDSISRVQSYLITQYNF